MIENIEVNGFVRAYVTPFSKPSGIIISTDRGDINIPVKNSSNYPLNQKVKVSVSVLVDTSDLLEVSDKDE